jgi:hypothetical protein
MVLARLIVRSVFLFSTLCFGQSTPCDPAFARVRANDPDHYMDRGGRCEGVFLLDIDGPGFGRGLSVASLTSNEMELTEWKSGSPLTIRWPRFGDAEIHIQASPLRPRLLYHFDSVQPAGSASYNWNTDLIAKYVPAKYVGFIASTTTLVDGVRQTVLLPVSFAAPSPAAARSYTLTVVAAYDMGEMFLTVAAMKGDGKLEKPLMSRTPLRFRDSVAYEPMRIQLPPLSREGLYLVQVDALRIDQGSVTTRFLLYHSPK